MWIFERIFAEDFLNALRRRTRIKQEIGFGVGAVLAGKRRVKQVVENFAIERSFFAVVAEKAVEQARVVGRRYCRVSAVIWHIAHANGELAKFVGRFRHSMSLQVEHQLQAMFELAKEAIGIVKHAVLEIGQTAYFRQGEEGLERVGKANVGEVPAVQKLEELNGEFDVADAAVPGFDFGVALAELA